ncbi:MAG: ABC transporter ATP-binding protein [Pseudomonadota bacterium]
MAAVVDDRAKAMSDIVISVRNVSKCYMVYENQRARLRQVFRPSSTEGVSKVQALQDINFDVKRGESLAIIGRNGGGKSTLLQILTGTLTPTTGTVQVNGRVAALLELGSGFNPEYTGRENVFLNGLLLGLSRAEVERKFDDIIGFADIGDVLDRPVKTYSSGMMMRLAFSVQVALEPEILIVDEALGVGDYFFQQKCFARLRQMRDSGLTLLFVSHDMGTVRDICQRAVYLRQGIQAFKGDALEAIRMYFAEGQPVPKKIVRPLIHKKATALTEDHFKELSTQALWSLSPELGTRLLAVHVIDSAGEHTTSVRLGASIVIRIYLRSDHSGMPLSIGLMFKNKYDQIIFSTNNRLLGIEILDGVDQSITIFEFDLDMTIEGGLYALKIICSNPTATSDSNDREESGWIGPIKVNWDYKSSPAPFLGMFGIPTRGRCIKTEKALQ